ncbi:Bax inhibitor-1/YccA family protein [Aeromicrobium sp. CTD01-1L150]|uniref:Bax inhibitor-1/YccA family protein n=1 Tax=Aeromicrobium sp. CTD01-1L150 TaxID=3341830 RepID=UPI0035BECC3E
MQSKNPVFARSEGFNGRGSATTASPASWKIDLDGAAGGPEAPIGTTDATRMSISSVIEKTAISLGLVVVAAAITWFATGDLDPGNPDAGRNTALLGGLLMVGIFGGLALSMVNSFKKVVSPPLVLAFAALQGVLVGALSKMIAFYIVGDPSIVFQAVLATFVAAGATLAAYKFFNIQVTDKFRKVMTIALVSVFGIMLVNFGLSMFGVLEQGGLRGFNTLGLVVSIGLAVLAIFTLIMDFDMVERGIEAGLPERESWRAAFGLTVTLVWLYIELLRILAIFASSD